MSGSVISRFRLFPIMIMMAVVALTMRGISLYTGVGLLVQPVAAEEQDADATQQATEGAAQQAQAPVEEAVNRPLMIGVPSTQEMELITQLRERRVELERREQQLDLQQQLLAGTEKRINDKIGQLQVLEERIKQHLKLFEKQEAEKLDQIVKVYETMKPKDAAPRFEALGLETQIDLVTRMKPAKVAALMEEMSPRAASVLTTELATLAQPPRIEEIQNSGN
ncbi:MAG: hypothetical protein EP335_03405 [Alphaproteobacteria bacterium]|nr:MAG: hypothetical protein EP335_03405 [Alphaproteobacteria bacterium]